MKMLSRIRRKCGWYDLKKEGAKWVEKNIGPEYVEEFCEKYDKLNRGIPIGGFLETAIFLEMIEQIKQRAE